MTDTPTPPVGAPFATGSTPPPPTSPGWAGAATAIHGLQQIARPMLMSLSPADFGTIAIDLRHQEYVWSVPLDQFPAEPSDVAVATYPIAGDDPGLAGPTLGLDPLLWLIGLHAFRGGRASWLRPGDKYRLKWWPELDLLTATDDQLHIVKTLAQALMTVEKTAQRARRPVEEVQQVVNALSLMSALRRIEGKGGSPVLPPMAGVVEAQPTRIRGRHVRRGG
ncbi:hypothetical protein M2152_001659 [Microbacteriaceae bacterium SG_E_30_P1]|uniref:Uncharacterized protein n=1 Tax=Antiquaquibacter oligotrophicus TaxID=2880260 RepID=A0ABT6KN89_9MICO|nr:hypothetical protein [Antiquaquibacter oligotrophicus]MDH6181477.1 hypothetical protein [Antiquaquibacter oligotrophicus]UDF12833.1 hypothetical protein LH407_11815 [Antiquaquibacter oligotrophicus]